jgi:hypothetical protein
MFYRVAFDLIGHPDRKAVTNTALRDLKEANLLDLLQRRYRTKTAAKTAAKSVEDATDVPVKIYEGYSVGITF